MISIDLDLRDLEQETQENINKELSKLINKEIKSLFEDDDIKQVIRKGLVEVIEYNISQLYTSDDEKSCEKLQKEILKSMKKMLKTK
jgi:hypothetical protein